MGHLINSFYSTNKANFMAGYKIAEKKYHKVGYWLEHHYYKTGDRQDYETPYECSVCGNRHGFPAHAHKYCFNCGAQMDGIKEI